MVQSIFSTYSQGENRVTSSIIQVLRNLPINVVEHFLIMFSEKDTQSFFHFENQVKGKDSVPDAEISANFRLLFETKIVPNGINEGQLDKHLELANRENTILVYLTPDQSKPKQLVDKQVVWKSFQHLFDLISELLKDPTFILSERDQFLLRNLQDFFYESKLLPKKDEVVVVAASTAWPVYQKYGIYVCQAERSFRDVGLIGFYAEGKIQRLIAKIYGQQKSFKFSKVNLEGDSELNVRLRKWLDENPEAEDFQLQVFDLSNKESNDTITLPNEIRNDLTNDSGRGYAFTQGQRYTLLSKLKEAETTSNL